MNNKKQSSLSTTNIFFPSKNNIGTGQTMSLNQTELVNAKRARHAIDTYDDSFDEVAAAISQIQPKSDSIVPKKKQQVFLFASFPFLFPFLSFPFLLFLYKKLSRIKKEKSSVSAAART